MRLCLRLKGPLCQRLNAPQRRIRVLPDGILVRQNTFIRRNMRLAVQQQFRQPLALQRCHILILTFFQRPLDFADFVSLALFHCRPDGMFNQKFMQRHNFSTPYLLFLSL